MGSRGASSGKSKQPKPMTEQEYLASKGLADASSGWIVDKLRGNRQLKTQKGQERFEKERQKAESEYQTKRNNAKAEYAKMVKQGKVRPKTMVEQAMDRAKGNPDLQATQAARRLLAKKGIDWKTGKKI